MIACVDGAPDVHAGANGPVLLEVGMVAFDRGSVGALLLPDLVCASIALVASVLGRADVIRGIMISHRFDHIVLNERIIRPPIEREICSAIGLECTSVVHQPGNRFVSINAEQKSWLGYTDMSRAG
jgi:hypothetical protein